MRVLLPEIPGGTGRVSPLVSAIQSRYQEDPDLEYELPNTIQALLWACCSPHDFGMPEVSPYRSAEIGRRHGSITVTATQSEPF